MKIKWKNGAYELGKYYDPGEVAEFNDDTALLFIERGLAVAVQEAPKAEAAPIETMEQPPAPETTTIKHKRVR